jgi:predicted metalloprotease with PDZ domain
MGDLMLLKSGVFDLKQYFKEFTAQLQKHFDNPGRFNHSVAASSYDTWLDGYVAGAPGRKVSIYTEGCLLAFVCDVKIRQHSNNKHGLDELMKRLYYNFALQGKGVAESDFSALLHELMGGEAEEMLRDYFYGTRPYEAILTDALEILGFELIQTVDKSYAAGRVGFKYAVSGGQTQVTAIYPGSPADLAGLMLNDQVIAVNSCKVENNVDDWLRFFDDENKQLHVFRAGKLVELNLPEVQRNFYITYSIKAVENPNSFQKKAFETWSS